MTRHQLYQIYRFGHVRPALTSIWGIHGQGRDFQRWKQSEKKKTYRSGVGGGVGSRGEKKFGTRDGGGDGG